VFFCESIKAKTKQPFKTSTALIELLFYCNIIMEKLFYIISIILTSVQYFDNNISTSAVCSELS